MRFIYLGFIALLLGNLIIQTQAMSDCAILVSYETEDDIRFTVYVPTGNEYLPIDSLIVRRSTILEQSILFSGQNKFAVQQSGNIDLYTISASGFDYIERMPSHEYSTVSPRENGWSPDGHFLALHNIMDNRNDRLFIYDTLQNTFFSPTELSSALHVTWSPNGQFLAFIAYDYIPNGMVSPEKRGYALYLSQYDGESIAVIPVDEHTLARFEWLSDEELAITHCQDVNCQLQVHNIITNQIEYRNTNNLLIESLIPSVNATLLTAIGDRNVFLSNANGEISQLTRADTVLSQPIISPNEEFISVRVEEDGVYKLVILNLANPSEVIFIKLFDEIPALLTSNRGGSFPYLYGFYYTFDDWHPYENLLLVADNGSIQVYDVEANTYQTVIAETSPLYLSPRWVC
jgi:Tol biopolymer transport system component